MRYEERAVIQSLPSGVPGLDIVLGGGFPEYSFNLITGGPGSGKTTLAHQIMFANATAERPALYFTVLGEPTLKMLRYQRQFSFALGRSPTLTASLRPSWRTVTPRPPRPSSRCSSAWSSFSADSSETTWQ